MNVLIKRATRPTLAGLILVLALTSWALAASSGLSKHVEGEFDLTVALDFTPTADQQTSIEDMLAQAAQDLYLMTEGAHSLAQVFIFSPDPDTGALRQWNEADVRFSNSADNGWGHINGFGQAGLYILIDDDLSDTDEAAHTLAHELGHYLYGAYDEYADNRGAANELLPEQPHSADNAKNTIMGDPAQYQRFSVDGDYGADEQNTAQVRMYGDSIWGMLCTHPMYDALTTIVNAFLGFKAQRNVYEDLIALDEPMNSGALTQPTDNPALTVTWVDGSEFVLLVARSATMANDRKMQAAASGAKSYLDRLVLDDTLTEYGALVAYNGVATTTQALELLDDALRNQIQNDLDALNPAGSRAMGTALRRGLNILTASPRTTTFKYLILVSDGTNEMGEDPTDTILDDLVAADIPVYCIGLGEDADMDTLGQIADATGGKAYLAQDSTPLNAVFADIRSRVSNDTLAGWNREEVSSGDSTCETEVTVDGTAELALFSMAYPENETATMTLTDPSNNAVANGDPGVTCYTEDGYAICRVDDPDQGDWTVEADVTSLAAGEEADVILAGMTDAKVGSQAWVSGGTFPEPILITALASRDLPITGEDPTCSYVHTASDGSLSFGTVTMYDDGVTPDTVADDGIYSGALVDYEDGEYDFTVTFENSAGNTVAEVGASFVSAVGDLPTDTNFSTAYRAASHGESYTGNATDYCDDGMPGGTGGAGGVGGGTGYKYTELIVDGPAVPARIDFDYDVDGFYFVAEPGYSYTVYTFDLYPREMSTILSLFGDSSISLVLATDTDTLNGSSIITYENIDDLEEIYLTVQKGDTGTGFYRIAVRTAQEPDRIDEESANAGCVLASGGVGALGWLLAVFIPALAVTVSRRRRR